MKETYDQFLRRMFGVDLRGIAIRTDALHIDDVPQVIDHILRNGPDDICRLSIVWNRNHPDIPTDDTPASWFGFNLDVTRNSGMSDTNDLYVGFFDDHPDQECPPGPVNVIVVRREHLNAASPFKPDEPPVVGERLIFNGQRWEARS